MATLDAQNAGSGGEVLVTSDLGGSAGISTGADTFQDIGGGYEGRGIGGGKGVGARLNSVGTGSYKPQVSINAVLSAAAELQHVPVRALVKNWTCAFSSEATCFRS